MAKQITRTVKVYNYTFAKIQKYDDGKVEITDTVERLFLERLGDWKCKDYIKATPELEGHVVVSVDVCERTYSMSLEAFINSATIISK